MALLSITKGVQKTITPEYQHRLFEAQVDADTSDKTAIIYDSETISASLGYLFLKHTLIFQIAEMLLCRKS